MSLTTPLTPLEELDLHLQEVKAILRNARINILDPFWFGDVDRATAHLNSMDEIIETLKAQRPAPALAPGKHEPEPILFAKKPRPRAQKGQ